MAQQQRKKKLEKNIEKGEIVIDEPIGPGSKTYCVRCGIAYSRKKGYFPVSHSPMYRGSGYAPVCNTCLDKMYETYCAELGAKEAMRRICMKLDLYWCEDIYNLVEKSVGVTSRIRAYIGKTNLYKYIDKNYDDTLKDEAEALANGTHLNQRIEYGDESLEASKEEIIPDPEVVDFWGSDFSPEFVQKLDRRYKYWTSDLDELDKGSVSLYKQICILEETINRDAAEGKPVDKNISMLNTVLGSANLKPVQKKSETDTSIDSTPFGVWIDRWENKRPVPDPDPDLQDVDGIIRYITTWFYGHISKALGIKNVHCEMYEKELEEMKIKRPELAEEDDEETLLNLIFGKSGE